MLCCTREEDKRRMKRSLRSRKESGNQRWEHEKGKESLFWVRKKRSQHTSLLLFVIKHLIIKSLCHSLLALMTRRRLSKPLQSLSTTMEQWQVCSWFHDKLLLHKFVFLRTHFLAYWIFFSHFLHGRIFNFNPSKPHFMGWDFIIFILVFFSYGQDWSFSYFKGPW